MDYYVRLERGRDLNVSEAVLDALARALRLNDTERDHLHALARPTHRRHRPMPPQQVRPGLYRVLEILTETPAMILGHRLDILAANSLARALYTDFNALPHQQRNWARYIFLDRGCRKLYVDWDLPARETVAALHLYAGRHPHDPQLAELIAELSQSSEDFRRWWAEYDVLRHTYGAKRYRHPVVGDLTLNYEALTVSDDPDQLLGLYTAEPGSQSEQALRLLSARTREAVSTSRRDSAALDG